MKTKKGKWFTIEREGMSHFGKRYVVNPPKNFMREKGTFYSTQSINLCEEAFLGITGLKLKPGQIAKFRLEMSIR